MVEFKVDKTPTGKSSPSKSKAWTGDVQSAALLKDIELSDVPRITTGLAEVDRVLGGGLVEGSVVLIGGDPGIGKSTLLIQVMTEVSKHLPSLYITGEESLKQVAMRARRLELPVDKLLVMAETSVDNILISAQKHQPKIMVIDSIQTIFSEQISSAPGSVSQVRESAATLVRYAKQNQVAVFLVGHVTKEGALAGPRVLEHMVDAVLYFEGDTDARFRMVRSVKNRFGAVNELGVFAMTETGLKQVSNPSAIFLSKTAEPSPGSVVVVAKEGTRPILVELQALVDESQGSYARRVCVGLDAQRINMLLAILHRHGGIFAQNMDVFLNVVGGVKVLETATDLAVLMAIVSSLKSQTLDKGLVIFGEVGLSGEIRPVSNGQERLKEAAKQGFSKAIIPKLNMANEQIEGLEVVPASHLSEVVGLLF
jgi:DNA repair protein RadA/Sms